MNVDQAKRDAARSALAELPAAGIVGLGSGSTTKLFVDEVARLVADGRALSAVATSEATRRQAASLGIPLLDDEGPWDIAVTVDGADEVDSRLHLIKGGGGAHTREKIVNFSSRRNVIIVDKSKISRRIGERRPVPIEVLRFGHLCTMRALSRFGRAEHRVADGKPVMTDTGNFIYDLHTGAIADPAALDRELHEIAGVVETGLFVGRADLVLVADEHEVGRLVRAPDAI
jgi:ribose 5-phosphate isomerase A